MKQSHDHCNTKKWSKHSIKSMKQRHETKTWNKDMKQRHKTKTLWRISHSSLDQRKASHRKLASSRTRVIEVSRRIEKWWNFCEIMKKFRNDDYLLCDEQSISCNTFKAFRVFCILSLKYFFTFFIFFSFLFFFSSVCRLSMIRHLLNSFIELIVT